MFSVSLLVVVIISCVSAAPNINEIRLTYNKLDEIPVVSPFIVGGKDTNATDHPYITALLVNFGSIGTALCGGVVIHINWVLTAAHCFYYQSQFAARSVSIRVGSNYYHSGGNQHSGIEIYHFGYDPSWYLHDIAVVKVTPSITLGKPILLPPPGFRVSPGAIVTIIGYGTLWEEGPLADQLQSANVTIIDQEECEKTYYPIIQDGIFCAGVPGGGIDSCQGDSGGPVVYWLPGIGLVVVGIVSFGNGCARDGYPGAYTNVGTYTDIINYVIQNF